MALTRGRKHLLPLAGIPHHHDDRAASDSRRHVPHAAWLVAPLGLATGVGNCSPQSVRPQGVSVRPSFVASGAALRRALSASVAGEAEQSQGPAGPLAHFPSTMTAQAWASTRTGIAKRGWQLYIGFSLFVNGAMVVYLGRFHQVCHVCGMELGGATRLVFTADWVCFCHQRGPVAAMEDVASQTQEATARGQGRGLCLAIMADCVACPAHACQRPPDMSLHFWMPCHSTPYYSVMHQPIDMRILDCGPR